MGTLIDTIGQRIGIFGGSFDPIHLGHLLAAEQCREQLRLDEVRFIPTAVSPFKTEQNSTASKHRLEMLQLAIGGNPSFRADDREIQRGGTSYTVETLREIRTENPAAEIVFLLGADSLAEFSLWREPSEICRLAFVAVMARGGHPAPELDHLKPFLPDSQKGETSDHLVLMPQCEVSSSAIRASVAAARSIRYQVPASVAAYIQHHRLYTSPS